MTLFSLSQEYTIDVFSYNPADRPLLLFPFNSLHQIDQALVSLVDKEKMRAKQANILEILKAWLKASAAERSQQAAASAEIIATEAKADNKVSEA